MNFVFSARLWTGCKCRVRQPLGSSFRLRQSALTATHPPPPCVPRPPHRPRPWMLLLRTMQD